MACTIATDDVDDTVATRALGERLGQTGIRVDVGVEIPADHLVVDEAQLEHHRLSSHVVAGREHEVAERVRHQSPVAEVDDRLEYVGVVAQDDRRSGSEQLLGKVLLLGNLTGLVLVAPVNADHDNFGSLGGRPYAVEEALFLRTGQCHTGPVVPGTETVWLDMGGGDEGHHRTVGNLDDLVGEGLSVVQAGTDDHHPDGSQGIEGVCQANLTVVTGVVVGHRDDVDAGVGDGLCRCERCTEHEHL